MSDTKNATSGDQDAARVAEIKAQDAAKAASDAEKSPEQRKADKARQDADDARARAAEADAGARALLPTMSVAEARMLVPVAPDVGAGDHMAQQFGNYPANPAPSKAEHADPEKCTVHLYMIVPDHPAGVRTTIVHPEMVGDYLRAGWNQSL